MAYEESIYNIVSQNDVYEIRKYGDRLAIQVNYTDQRGGFRELFNYISGSNSNSLKINMTVPATQFNENGINTMQFFLPENFTKNNAPTPINKQVKLLTIKSGYFAVIKYSGRLTKKNFDKYTNLLKKNLTKDNIKILSSPIRATYNQPFTLPFLRRNEVIFSVLWKSN